jgi:glutamine synthetase
MATRNSTQSLEEFMAVEVGGKSKTSPSEVLAKARQAGVQVVDVRFVDLVGTWQHFSIPVGELEESTFADGLGFDGSSIRGFQAIHESDMLLMPDPDTATIDPVLKIPTMYIVCDVVDPLSGEPYSRDPRFIAKKAESYLASTGIADVSYWGPEAEFYIFNSLRFDQNMNSGYYFIDSEEGIWNSGSNGTGPNLAYRPRPKEGYFPVPPMDKFQDLRSEIMIKLIEAGVDVEVQHHEVGTAGQAEIDMRFNTLVKMADAMMTYKYVVKSVCYQNGYVATFMPKPLFQDNGSGMHVHQSLWKAGQTLMAGDGYAGLSDLSRWYIGGLLRHAASLLAFCAPTTNSYRRLVPGYEAPINLVYSARNRSACVRIPMYSSNPKAKRVEFRSPDPSANPYLAFSAMLMAGLDGIQNRIEPPEPLNVDFYELEGEEKEKIEQVPGSLQETLTALKNDHAYLLKGGVFTADVIEAWIEYKWKREVEAVALRPHPYEFYLYHDA